MFQLYIDDKPAVIKTGTTVKLTRENPFFTSSGDYTFDVVLPLTGCLKNLKIFGPVNFNAVSLKFLARKKYTFRLVTELLTLEGTAIVTNVTQDEVKVQLLAGNSALNFDTLGEDGEKYIDDFDLGRAYGDLWDRYHPDEEQTDVGTVRMLMSAPFTIEQTDKLLHGSVAETDCVCFPIFSDTDGMWANEHQYAFWGTTNGEKWTDQLRTYRFKLLANQPYPTPRMFEYYPNTEPYDVQPPLMNLDQNFILSPQPYLCIIVERVLGALGYSLAPEDNTLHRDWMGQVFIANARGTLHFAGCVPHWTVKEFFTELRNLFGVIVLVEGKRARVVSRTTLYTSGSAVEIHSATDERSTDIDTEGEQKETTSGNVGYAFTDIVDRQLAIGEDAYEKMDVRRVADADLVAAFQSVGEEERAKSNILFYATHSGDRFGIFYNADTKRFSFPEVDHLGPLFRDEDFKVDTQLRIVPASMAEDKKLSIRTFSDRYKIWEDGNESEDGHYEIIEFGGPYANIFYNDLDKNVPYLITKDTVLANQKYKFNLQEYIQNEEQNEEENQKQEIMEVAVNSDQNFKDNISFQFDSDYFNTEIKIPYPVGIPYYRSHLDNNFIHIQESKHFLLHCPGSPVNECLQNDNLNIDTRVLKKITFIDRETNPNNVFLINGRKYLCLKIELNVDKQGIQPLKTGYFYEIQ